MAGNGAYRECLRLQVEDGGAVTKHHVSPEMETVSRSALTDWSELLTKGIAVSKSAKRRADGSLDVERYVPSLSEMLAAHPHAEEMMRTGQVHRWLLGLIRILLQ
jgi:hypothetical protein